MEVAHARLSLHLSKCHIVGNHMSWLKCYLDTNTEHRFSLDVMTRDLSAEKEIFFVNNKGTEQSVHLQSDQRLCYLLSGKCIS